MAQNLAWIRAAVSEKPELMDRQRMTRCLHHDDKQKSKIQNFEKKKKKMIWRYDGTFPTNLTLICFQGCEKTGFIIVYGRTNDAHPCDHSSSAVQQHKAELTKPSAVKTCITDNYVASMVK